MRAHGRVRARAHVRARAWLRAGCHARRRRAATGRDTRRSPRAAAAACPTRAAPCCPTLTGRQPAGGCVGRGRAVHDAHPEGAIHQPRGVPGGQGCAAWAAALCGSCCGWVGRRCMDACRGCRSAGGRATHAEVSSPAAAAGPLQLRRRGAEGQHASAPAPPVHCVTPPRFARPPQPGPHLPPPLARGPPGKYIIDAATMRALQKHAVVLHPLPRVDEVRSAPTSGPQAPPACGCAQAQHLPCFRAGAPCGRNG